MTDIEKLIKLLEHAESFSLEAYGKSPNLSECSLNIQYLRACILQAIGNAKALRERLAQEPVLQDIEQYRMQMASISTAAIGYWKEGDGIHPDYDTPALRDVAMLYAKYDALYKAQPDPLQRLTDVQQEIEAALAPEQGRLEWQGLTDEAMRTLADEHLKYQPESYEVSGVFDLIRAVEAKLKEKND